MSEDNLLGQSHHTVSAAAAEVLTNLRKAREGAGISQEALGNQLNLGPGWIESFEMGASALDLETLLVLAQGIGVNPAALFVEFDGGDKYHSKSESELLVRRCLRATQMGNDVLVHFDYGKYDANYLLRGASVSEFEEVTAALRNELSKLILVSNRSDSDLNQIKSDAVCVSFLKAVELWPAVNPSDLWCFVVYRAYCDPYNHPAQFARLSFEQSWKRAGGWALEKILVSHYRDAFAAHGLSIEIPYGRRKDVLAEQIIVDARVEKDKIDVFLLGPDDTVFGIVNVKASFAERRTDDVPLSEALIRAGYYSPLWTMDCKSTPGEWPINRGELGVASGRRSAKRKDFEDDGSFSACFSYNQNTQPSASVDTVKAPVICCNFEDPNDEFLKSALQAWSLFSKA